MRGCEIEGKVRFANPALNLPRKPVRADQNTALDTEPAQPERPRRRLPF